MLKAIFFDLDGTLLPMNEKEFVNNYFYLMGKHMQQYGFDPLKLKDAIWKGTYSMYKNDGSKLNEEVFWQTFEEEYGVSGFVDKKKFDIFYENEFLTLKSNCQDNPLAKDIIKFCRENVNYVVLSTNPIFPKVGTKNRMGFIGLKPEDFDYVTVYENSRYCKPNPKYFMDLLNKFNLKSDEVILFGNNTYEDGDCSYQCNIKCYLVDGNIIYHPKTKNVFEIIKMDEIIPTIIEEIENRK